MPHGGGVAATENAVFTATRLFHPLLNIGKPTDAQINQALNEAQTSVSLSPNICASCQEIFGDVLMKLNRKDEAKAAYQRGLAVAQAIHPEFQDDEIASLRKKVQQ